MKGWGLEVSRRLAKSLLKRVQNPDDGSSYFIKYSRLQKLTPLQATHGHLGYLEMRLLGSGTCLTSAAVGTAFYFDGGTAFIAGVSAGAPIDVYGNAPQVQLDAPVGVLAQMEDAAPVVNTGYLTGTDVSVSVLALRYTSPSAFSGHDASTVSIDAKAARGIAAHVATLQSDRGPAGAHAACALVKLAYASPHHRTKIIQAGALKPLVELLLYEEYHPSYDHPSQNWEARV